MVSCARRQRVSKNTIESVVYRDGCRVGPSGPNRAVDWLSRKRCLVSSVRRHQRPALARVTTVSFPEKPSCRENSRCLRLSAEFSGVWAYTPHLDMDPRGRPSRSASASEEMPCCFISARIKSRCCGQSSSMRRCGCVAGLVLGCAGVARSRSLFRTSARYTCRGGLIIGHQLAQRPAQRGGRRAVAERRNRIDGRQPAETSLWLVSMTAFPLAATIIALCTCWASKAEALTCPAREMHGVAHRAARRRLRSPGARELRAAGSETRRMRCGADQYREARITTARPMMTTCDRCSSRSVASISPSSPRV